jgi:hypothetical protein
VAGSGHGRGRERERGLGLGRGGAGAGRGARAASAVVDDSDSDSAAGAGDVSEEMSDDSEEFVPKAVTGTAQDKTGTHTLYLVEWDDFSNLIDFMREPRANFGEHAVLTDAFVTAWRAAGKPWPPAPAR